MQSSAEYDEFILFCARKEVVLLHHQKDWAYQYFCCGRRNPMAQIMPARRSGKSFFIDLVSEFNAHRRNT